MCTDPVFFDTVIVPMVATGLATMVFVIALIYMAAQLFKRPEYEAFASIEIYQVGVSAILLITVLGASCFASELSNAFAGADTFAVGRGYLDYIANDIALPAVMEIQFSILAFQWLGSWSMRFGPSVWGLVMPQFAGLILFERVFELILTIISPFAASLLVQEIILEAIRGTALPFILPAGVVLRVFPPTRDAGTFMITAALAFQIVFAYSYVMHNVIVRDMVSYAYANEQKIEDVLEPKYPHLLESIQMDGAFNLTNSLFHPLLSLSFLMLQALFLPVFTMTLTIAFIRGVSKFISQKLG